MSRHAHPPVCMKMDISDSHCFPSCLLSLSFGLRNPVQLGSPVPPTNTQKAEPCLNPAALINRTDFVNYLFGWLTACV